MHMHSLGTVEFIITKLATAIPTSVQHNSLVTTVTYVFDKQCFISDR